MMRKSLIFAGLIFIAVPLFAQSGQWLHVRVQEQGEENESVRVNLPVSLVSTLLPILEAHGLDEHGVNLNGSDLSVAQLREIWSEVKSQGDYELASVQSEEATVRVALEGNYLIVRSAEGSKTQVDVSLPGEVVDALLSGEGEKLNVKGAVEALIAVGGGELVSVKDGDTFVRVWIDNSNVAE